MMDVKELFVSTEEAVFIRGILIDEVHRRARAMKDLMTLGELEVAVDELGGIIEFIHKLEEG